MAPTTLESTLFPNPPSTHQPVINNTLEYEVSGLFRVTSDHHQEWSVTCVVHAAWAILASRHTNSENVTFDTMLPQTQPVSLSGSKHIESKSKPYTASMQIRISRNQSLPKYLRDLETRKLEGEYHFCEDHQDICQGRKAQSLIYAQPQTGNQSEISEHEILWPPRGLHTYSLIVRCIVKSGDIRIEANFDSRVVSPWVTARLVRQFGFLMEQLVVVTPDSDLKIADVDIMHPQDLLDLSDWNREEPGMLDCCLHTLVEEQASQRLDDLAVDAWDGKFSYKTLSNLSSRLACVLSGLGVGPEVIVPVCFEKSRFAVVAVLAVLKANGAFLLLEPSLPTARLERLTQKTEACIILASKSTVNLVDKLAKHIVIVDEDSLLAMQNTAEVYNIVTPENTAYVIFSSGSTGEPKGCKVEHRSISFAMARMAPAVGISAGIRVLQCGSYSFTGAITETFFALVQGACLCIPAEESRRTQLDRVFANMKINWAFLTSTVLELIEPQDTPYLTTLCIGGEPIRKSQIEKWIDHVHLLHAYGSAETSGINSCLPVTPDSAPSDIGKPHAARFWIVNPDDCSILAPLGGVGEVLVEGVVVGREYLKDPQQTAKSFVRTPSWRNRMFDLAPFSRFYRTGDLGMYGEGGTISLLGRKDTQIKLLGQRVELEEIEHQVRIADPGVTDVGVELISPQSGASPFLACFLVQAATTASDMTTNTQSNTLKPVTEPVTHNIVEKIKDILPRHMVPTDFYSIPRLPINSSGKTDRKQLRAIGDSKAAQTLRNPPKIAKLGENEHLDESEKLQQQLWALVLKLDPSTIGRNDNFFNIGGDSISAMKMVRISGRAFTMSDIFRHPVLKDLAKLAIRQEEPEPEPVPFSLLGNAEDLNEIMREIALDYEITPESIEDIYPCSPLQEGLLALTMKCPEAYVMQSVLKLPLNFQQEAFKAAWEHATSILPILRTRFVQSRRIGMLQVVTKDSLRWTYSTEDQETFLKQDISKPVELGEQLIRFAFLKDPIDRRVRFVWTAHHAVFDAWSIPRILELVNRVQQNTLLPPLRQYKYFIRYLIRQDLESQASYWKTALAGFHTPPFPMLPHGLQHPLADATVEIEASPLTHRQGSFRTTTSTLVRAAWALIVSHHAGANDVTFGSIVSGRNTPIASIEDIIGPTLATVPVRVHVTGNQRVHSYLETLHTQSVEMMPYEQMGLQRIALTSEESLHACQFQSLIVVQPAKEDLSQDDEQNKWYRDIDIRSDITTFALTIQHVSQPKYAKLIAKYDPRALEEWQVESMLKQLDFVMQQLANATFTQRLLDIKILTQKDTEMLWEWNQQLPSAIEQCVHDLISDRARSSPDAQAVSSWDGNLTYGELNILSTRFADRLRILGVQPGSEVIIPLYIERSIWVPVAMLAVMKAGGAFVALDPQDAPGRKEYILRHVDPILVITSSQYRDMFLGTHVNVEIVGFEMSHKWPQTLTLGPPITSRLSSAAYLIFTSGSTGDPKGVVIEHQSIATSCVIHGKTIGLNSDSRVLHFASYAFDAYIMEILTSLVFGACVLVPNESERLNELGTYIQRAKPTVAFLVPSVARLLDPVQVPSLETLVTGGEPSRARDFQRWEGHVNVIHAYGPTECSVFCSMKTIQFKAGEESCIGFGVGATTWVVDSSNHQILKPPGAIGELLVEGPIIAREYFKEPEKSAASFVTDPEWLVGGALGFPGRHGRVYKTGDLVRYLQDGSLEYVGRKDRQLKIHGQRVELGEVEHHLSRCFWAQNNIQIIVELILGRDDSNDQHVLMAFVAQDVATRDRDVQLQELDRIEIESLRRDLAQFVPSYMIPTAFVRLRPIPYTASGKIDRKHIQDLGRKHLWSTCNASETKFAQLPRTETEQKLVELWASILRLKTEQISVDQSFLELGGDSISLMSLTYALRASFQRSIPICQLGQKDATIAALATVIDGGVSELSLSSNLNSVHERLSYWTSKLHRDLESIEIPERIDLPHHIVFLTGATGYIGTHVLQRLVHNPAVAMVIVLTRPQGGLSGYERLCHSAQSAGWWTNDAACKVESWDGDLGKMMFGLSEAQWSRLCGNGPRNTCATAIIHIGAAVNFSASLESLEQVNVQSTLQLLHFTASSPSIERFIYVSGGSFSTIDDEFINAAELAGAEGYSQSKYVAEKMVVEMARRLQSSWKTLVVVRPGRVIGDLDTPVSNVDDYMWRLAVTTVSLETYPEPVPGAWLAISPVGHVADIILNRFENQDPPLLVTISDGLPASCFWSIVQKHTRKNLRPLSWEEWLHHVQEDISIHKELHPLWPVQHILHNIGNPPDESKKEVFFTPSQLEEVICKNVGYLSEHGYLLGFKEYSENQMGAFRRSKMTAT